MIGPVEVVVVLVDSVVTDDESDEALEVVLVDPADDVPDETAGDVLEDEAEEPEDMLAIVLDVLEGTGFVLVVADVVVTPVPVPVVTELVFELVADVPELVLVLVDELETPVPELLVLPPVPELPVDLTEVVVVLDVTVTCFVTLVACSDFTWDTLPSSVFQYTCRSDPIMIHIWK